MMRLVDRHASVPATCTLCQNSERSGLGGTRQHDFKGVHTFLHFENMFHQRSQIYFQAAGAQRWSNKVPEATNAKVHQLWHNVVLLTASICAIREYSLKVRRTCLSNARGSLWSGTRKLRF